LALADVDGVDRHALFDRLGGQAIINCSPVERIHFKFGRHERLNRWAKLDKTIGGLTADVSGWDGPGRSKVDAANRKAWANPIPVA